MKQTMLFILFFSILFCAMSQDRVVDYKYIADKEIAQYFDSSLVSVMTCEEVEFSDINNTETWSPNYENVKFEKVAMKPISFTYSFFSMPLNNSFSFYISITKQKNKKITISGLEHIPACILKNKDCNFIKRDSAINIAIRDSILYPENLTIRFERRHNSKDYYWVIEGDPIVTDPTVNRRTARKVSTQSRKYINAITGQLVSSQDYYKPG